MPFFGYDGNTTSGQFINDIITGGLFTCPEEATPVSIAARLYAWNTGGLAKCAIYDESGHLLCSTEELVVPPTWVVDLVFNIVGSRPALHVNVNYYLVVWGSSGSTVAISNTWLPPNSVAIANVAYGDSFPETVSFSSAANNIVAIYCNYTPGLPVQHDLTISATAGGTTNPAPNTYAYSEGAVVPVTAIPSSGYILDYWLLGVVNVGSVNPFSVIMDADYTLQAVFVEAPPPTPVTLTMQATTNGTTNPVSPGTYPYMSGDTVTLSAVPSSNYILSYWLINGMNAGAINPYQFIIPADTTVQAVFAIAPPPGATLPLHTDGQYVKDSSGKIIYLRGVNYPSGFTASCAGCFPADGDWLWGAGYTSLSAASLDARLAEMKSYGFNTIRFIFNPDWWRNNSAINLDGQATSIHIREAMLQVIQAAQAYGIYCVICPWSGNPDPLSVFGSQANFVTMWTQVAQMYGSEPNVIFELFNEPDGNYDAILNAFVAATAAIRQYSSNIVMVQWSYCGSFDFVNDYAPVLEPYGNIVYSNHIYRYPCSPEATFPCGSATTKTSIDTRLRTAWSYSSVIGRYPMFIGEIGAYTTQGSSEVTWFANCLSVLNDYGAGYAGWEWGQGGTNWELSTINSSTAPFRPNSNSGQALVNAIAAGTPSEETVNLTISATTGGTTNPAPNTYAYTINSTAQVRAIAGSGYNFDHWVLDGTNAGSISLISVPMNADRTLQAVFVAIPQYTLHISASSGGTTEPTPADYLINENVQQPVLAIPDTDYRFDHWELDTTIITDNPIAVTMDKDYSLRAVFEYVPPQQIKATLQGYVKDTTGAPIQAATVTCDGYADITEADGSYAFVDIPANVYTLTVTMTGYQPTSIQVDASTGGTYPNELVLVPVPTYNLTIATTIGGTTEPVPNTYVKNVGDIVTVTAIANAGYTFRHFELDGEVKMQNPINVGMDSDHTLIAMFVIVAPPIPSALALLFLLAIPTGVGVGAVITKKGGV